MATRHPRRMRRLILAAAFAALATPAMAFAKERTLALDHLTLVGARSETVVYRGQRAVHLQSRLGHEADDDSMLSIVTDSDFGDGIMEIDVACTTVAQAPNAPWVLGG